MYRYSIPYPLNVHSATETVASMVVITNSTLGKDGDPSTTVSFYVPCKDASADSRHAQVNVMCTVQVSV